MLYINGRFLTQDITGVQRFAFEISKELNLIRDDIVFLVSDLSLVKIDKENFNFKIKETGGFHGHLWEQISLPIFLKKNNSPLLLNLCNTAPAFYKNQIVTHHDITYLKYPKSFPLKFRLVYKFLAKRMFKNSIDIITVSEFSKGEIYNEFKCDSKKINVIYNAVNEGFKPKLNQCERKKFALAVSSPAYHKNFHGLVNLFNEHDFGVELKVIGKASSVFSAVELKSDNQRIKFLGRVTDDELINLYQDASIFIFPSFYEGFGIPPLEAQACGCPVISSNKASMKEVLGDSALYFDPTSKEEMSAAICKALSSNKIRESLSCKGAENVKRFSWAASARQVNDIISNKV